MLEFQALSADFLQFRLQFDFIHVIKPPDEVLGIKTSSLVPGKHQGSAQNKLSHCVSVVLLSPFILFVR